jgi:hypothetical protein
MTLRPMVGTGFELATGAGLVLVLLAQAVAIVVAEPWREGATLVTLGPGRGVSMGDLPAAVLVVLAVAVAILSARRLLPSAKPARLR